MTAAFLLPLAQGACVALGGNIVTDAFGVVAMVAMTPLITIQVMGLYSKLAEKKKTAAVPAPAYAFDLLDDDAIIGAVICAGSAYYSDGSTERQEGSRGYRRAVLQRIYAAQRCGM